MVAHIVVPSINKNIVFSQTIGPIELKFHVKTSYDKSAKLYTKYDGHMTKIATTPIYGKSLLKNLLFQNQKASDLETWYVVLGCGAFQVCSYDDPRVTLTYLTSRSSLLPNAFEWEIF